MECHNFENRRVLLKSILSFLGAFPLRIHSKNANAVERAVGSAEQSCREAGDCLQKGDWDGAIGWNWGAKDRCDATDPQCGPDGKYRDVVPSSTPDRLSLKVTDVVQIDLIVGRSQQAILRMGLYGESCPKSVKQMLQFCDNFSGLMTSSQLFFESGLGLDSAPVSLARGGALNVIYPDERLDFGIPSQSTAYSRSKNLSKAGDNFIAQPRPPIKVFEEISSEPSARPHDTAGLISIPKKRPRICRRREFK